MRMEEKKNHEYLHAFWLEQMVDGDVIQLEEAQKYPEFHITILFPCFPMHP